MGSLVCCVSRLLSAPDVCLGPQSQEMARLVTGLRAQARERPHRPHARRTLWQCSLRRWGGSGQCSRISGVTTNSTLQRQSQSKRRRCTDRTDGWRWQRVPGWHRCPRARRSLRCARSLSRISAAQSDRAGAHGARSRLRFPTLAHGRTASIRRRSKKRTRPISTAWLRASEPDRCASSAVRKIAGISARW
jgi:hypothetical protein